MNIERDNFSGVISIRPTALITQLNIHEILRKSQFVCLCEELTRMKTCLRRILLNGLTLKV
ncbi:CLUMA_CG017202, isoform A [Clunio marinus]|uniref:CLUMA_CG017202, isoform A n=1 Tax=Clunio marinus TaxID=568069 RepID=A0A1J1IZS7_9DIPT|nr:CLUMA_CG017202, isoform A [Clunio marinus]